VSILFGHHSYLLVHFFSSEDMMLLVFGGSAVVVIVGEFSFAHSFIKDTLAKYKSLFFHSHHRDHPTATFGADNATEHGKGEKM
jgi:hypothetical protein